MNDYWFVARICSVFTQPPGGKTIRLRWIHVYMRCKLKKGRRMKTGRTDRQTDRHMDRQTGRRVGRETDKQADSETHTQKTGRQTDRRIERERQASRQTAAPCPPTWTAAGPSCWGPASLSPLHVCRSPPGCSWLHHAPGQHHIDNNNNNNNNDTNNLYKKMQLI